MKSCQVPYTVLRNMWIPINVSSVLLQLHKITNPGHCTYTVVQYTHTILNIIKWDSMLRQIYAMCLKPILCAYSSIQNMWNLFESLAWLYEVHKKPLQWKHWYAPCQTNTPHSIHSPVPNRHSFSMAREGASCCTASVVLDCLRK